MNHENEFDKARDAATGWQGWTPFEIATHFWKAGVHIATEAAEREYGTARDVTDGWEPGDRFGDRQYIDPRSISDRPDVDRSTVTGQRNPEQAVSRRKAGPWERYTP